MNTNICITNLPAGIDTSCFAFESPVKNILIVGTSHSYASVAAAMSKAAWTADIASLAAYVPNGLASYEPKSEEPKYNTTAYGKKFLVRDAMPAAQMLLETGSGDFAELLKTLRGGLYRVFFLLENGSIKGFVDDDGTFKGFSARVHAHTDGVQKLDAPEGFYPVELMFEEYEEFVNGYVLNITWNAPRELVAAMPFGLSMVTAGAYNETTGVQSVYITSRGGSPYSGLTASDFIVKSANVDTPVITTATDKGSGLYDLTVNKESTPVALAAGDFVELRVEKGSPITAVSSRLTING